MANTDTLLDLGEGGQTQEPSSPSIPHENTKSGDNQIGSPLEFDPLSPSMDQEPREGEPGELDEFDPFAVQTKSPSEHTKEPIDLLGGEVHDTDISVTDYIVQEQDSDLKEGEDVDLTLGEQQDQNLLDTTDFIVAGNMSGSEIPAADQKHLEAQFDDLLGDLGGDSQVNGVAMDTVVKEETKTEVNGDVVMTTTTKTTHKTEDGEVQSDIADVHVNDLADTSSSQSHTSSVHEVAGSTEGSDTTSDGGRSPEPRSTAPPIDEEYLQQPAAPQSDLWEDDGQDFQPPKRYVKQEDTRDSRAPGVIIMGGAGDMSCKACQKRVYEMEKVIADKAIYHKTCFKCTHCKRILSLGNFAAIEGQLYCKPHFLEIFKTKESHVNEGRKKKKVPTATLR